MIFAIEVQNEAAYPLDPDSLIAAVSAVLVAHDVSPDSGITVVITDDEAVASLMSCRFRQTRCQWKSRMRRRIWVIW